MSLYFENYPPLKFKCDVFLLTTQENFTIVKVLDFPDTLVYIVSVSIIRYGRMERPLLHE